MVHVETATFECGGCGRRSPSTWIDYDRLGYPVCPECGRVERPFAVRPFGAGVARPGGVDAEASGETSAASATTPAEPPR
ncbi:hypothetical protein [Halobaculum lipolyticum]|uniref:GATA-type domain-containing protein n=1 Tax=Halobaculum lipolyticum TaxID=3032001 RepID=A0ABD5WHF2_9EURY|nr:hypothetical protein [Halobaculum sp. DT31]